MKQALRHGLSTAALMTLASAAAAQDVQIYGIADLYVGSVKGSTSKTVVDDGGSAASRLGFRGREDLGGGQSAYFALEMGMFVDTGVLAINNGFGRLAMVGYRAPWGAIELGRQYTPLFHNMLATAPFGMNANWAPVQLSTSADGEPAAVRTLGFALRQPNMVRYRYGNGAAAKGLTVDVVAAPGEESTTSGSSLGFGASYRADNFFIGYATQSMNSGTAAVRAFKNKIQGMSGSYDLGDLTLSLNYLISDSTLPAARKITHTSIGAAYDMGPHRWMVEMNRRDLKGSPNDAVATVIGYDYKLSKRTSLYGRVAHLNNKGTAANVMAQATVLANSGADVRGVALGMRHNF